MADQRLIVALDFSCVEKTQQIVQQLGDTVRHYKVGMELYYSVGSEVVKYLTGMGKEVFLDLKLHDIPNTVSRSAAVLCRLGVTMFNVHAVGGEKMMSDAVQSATNTAQALGLARPKLLAVTVLTSLNTNEFKQVGYEHSINEQVVRMAKLAQNAGMDGVVASPQEASAIRQSCGEGFLIVTPGIRPSGTSSDDQQRIATPAGALASGATHLVVGRPITEAADPNQAAEDILREMRGE